LSFNRESRAICTSSAVLPTPARAMTNPILLDSLASLSPFRWRMGFFSISSCFCMVAS